MSLNLTEATFLSIRKDPFKKGSSILIYQCISRAEIGRKAVEKKLFKKNENHKEKVKSELKTTVYCITTNFGIIEIFLLRFVTIIGPSVVVNVTKVPSKIFDHARQLR